MLHLLKVPPRADKSWSALNITVKLLYFERFWVIQEILVAGKAVGHFSEGAISWNMFSDACSRLLRFPFHISDLSPINPQEGIHLSQILKVNWQAQKKPQRWRLYCLVRETTMLKSTDARDDILALAGFAQAR